ncbi:transketolase C-terminal domain-containing protein [Actinosynnema sp. NPDC047251]|uniref:Transketolase n=1 Tax=Saccharothrix espanaensis (strain ATCC 51144 / DSM 44229 / JCM 9112 / NBRC 15066 / NRRL 15764) TaxID=1179773 RepID=K0K5Q1_SACES|nr:transketolase C-terminal domain-containing protein [Saccharothrix espanaensis]CCH32932.1 Transketolase [Saccharothrix espanaensis DSM 44229]
MSTDTPTTRAAYRDHLVGMMAADPRLVCLDTDSGLFSGVDFGPASDRYLNLGIAEHNLMGVAAGLAATGWVPFVNTMATFAATRALEAVKIDIAYNNLPVRIVATHGGVASGHLGPTHQSLEDLAVMRTLPNMTVVVPGGPGSTTALLDQLAGVPGPVYLRLGRKATPELPADVPAPELGRLQRLRAGTAVVLVATGPLPVLRALDAADLLAADGLAAGVLHVHTVKPLDAAGLLAQTRDARLVVTIEEHWRTGGLGSAVAEALSDHGPRRVLRLGLPDEFVATVGTQEELLDAAGVTAAGIAAAGRGHR